MATTKIKLRKPSHSLKKIIDMLCDKNPNVEDNLMYLVTEVWDIQGLKLYPNQREKLLSGELFPPDGIARQLRRYKAAKSATPKPSLSDYAD